MSDDLDELARAAQESPRLAIPPLQARSRGPLSVPAIIALVIGGMAVFAVGIFIIASLVARDGNAATGPSLFGGGNSNPEFTINRRAHVDGGTLTHAHWEILNESKAPLIITRLRLNDEFDCPIGDVREGWIQPFETPSYSPVTLSIGETAYFFEYFLGQPEHSYKKRIIFADIDTNRGNFRYRDGLLTDR